ncbi:choice-of-anchor L domain-containing protein, partial [Anaerorhabdus sp.]|uniref:choice-of-anchor L domain-containing protein n=1 Tax=Anaerorhabdus sp. TaxID=1872524 RepID=UPI002FC7B4AA
MESKINIHLKKQMFLLIGLISSFVFSQTPVTYTANPTNAQINTALNGNNISITGGTLNFGDRTLQIATFTGGTAAALQMNNGVFFGTGNVAKLLTTNTETASTDDILTAATFSDPDLSLIDATATNDVVSYSFTVTLGPKATSLSIGYQFGSEEYPDYVGSNFDDAFGFFVTGPGIAGTSNLARLPNGNATSINKVNFGLEGSSGSSVPAFDGTQSALYMNNGHDTTVSGGKLVPNTNPGPFPIAVQFNGITKLITYTLSGLTPNGTYTFKIVIADAGDATLDTGVFIDNIYATATLVANNDSYTIVSGSSSINSVLNNDSVNGTAPATLSDVLLSQISTTNAGVTLNPLTGQINVAPGTPSGTYAVTYQICDQTFTSNCKTAVATIIVQTDFDGDGVIDDNDLDDDNDGILDCVEQGLDKPINQIFE